MFNQLFNSSYSQIPLQFQGSSLYVYRQLSCAQSFGYCIDLQIGFLLHSTRYNLFMYRNLNYLKIKFNKNIYFRVLCISSHHCMKIINKCKQINQDKFNNKYALEEERVFWCILIIEFVLNYLLTFIFYVIYLLILQPCSSFPWYQ